MKKERYSTDLSDTQWKLLQCVLPRAVNGRTGRPRKYPLREVFNALLYQARTGCQWRLLPREFPPWQSVYDQFRRWKADGTWEQIHDALREQVRVSAGRELSPSAGILDSQSVRVAGKRGVAGESTRARRLPDASGTCV